MQSLFKQFLFGLSLVVFGVTTGAPSANGGLAPSQFEGHALPILCNRSMETFVPTLVMQFQRLHPDVDFKLDMAVRFPFDRSALGENVNEIFDDMSGARFFSKYGHGPLTVMISAGGRHVPGILQSIGVFVHPSNSLRSISMEQLEQIYGKTPRGGMPRITKWGQLGLTGEWAGRPVVVYGITHFGGAPGGLFNYRVLGDGECCDDCRELMHSPPMISTVAGDPNAIGYIAMTYVNSSVKLLPVAPRGGSAPVEPTEVNDQQLRYPLNTPFYFCVNRVPGQPLDPYIKDFIALTLSPAGQKAIADAGYLPLPEDVIREQLKTLEQAP